MKKFLLLTLVFFSVKVYSQSSVDDFNYEISYINCDRVRAHFYFDGNTTIDVDSCVWHYGDGVKKYSDFSNSAEHTYSKPGTYSVELDLWKDGVMSSVKKDSIITVYEAPVPSFRYEVSDSLFFAPLTVQFFNTTEKTDGDSLSYTWEIYGNDTLYTSENPTITFNEPRAWYVVLNVSSKQGCEKGYSECIIVKDSAQRGEFPLNMSECFGDSQTSPCGYERQFEIIDDTLVISGFYYGNCGTTKTATVNYSGDTIVVKIWETGEHTTCGCGYCFEIKVPDVHTDSVLVNFNNELKTATITGINETQMSEESFDVYPNPAEDVITIDLKNRNTECFEYSIFDIKGKIRQTGNVDYENNTIELNRANINSGMFILVILTDDHQSYSKKLFVR